MIHIEYVVNIEYIIQYKHYQLFKTFIPQNRLQLILFLCLNKLVQFAEARSHSSGQIFKS